MPSVVIHHPFTVESAETDIIRQGVPSMAWLRDGVSVSAYVVVSDMRKQADALYKATKALRTLHVIGEESDVKVLDAIAPCSVVKDFVVFMISPNGE